MIYLTPNHIFTEVFIDGEPRRMTIEDLPDGEWLVSADKSIAVGPFATPSDLASYVKDTGFWTGESIITVACGDVTATRTKLAP